MFGTCRHRCTSHSQRKMRWSSASTNRTACHDTASRASSGTAASRWWSRCSARALRATGSARQMGCRAAASAVPSGRPRRGGLRHAMSQVDPSTASRIAPPATTSRWSTEMPSATSSRAVSGRSRRSRRSGAPPPGGRTAWTVAVAPKTLGCGDGKITLVVGGECDARLGAGASRPCPLRTASSSRLARSVARLAGTWVIRSRRMGLPGWYSTVLPSASVTPLPMFPGASGLPR